MADGYGEFVQRELDDQRTAKASLEQRGMAVITSSGVVLTLLFGLAAVAESNSRFNIADAARPWLYASGGFFGGAAILALVTSVPLRYKAPKPEALVRQVREAWTEPEATQRVALTRVGMIVELQTKERLQGMGADVRDGCSGCRNPLTSRGHQASNRARLRTVHEPALIPL
jgi:hypothetical protein